MKQNLHTHSTYCDGKSTINEMIRSALMKEFDVLGFSGHSFTGFDTGYCMSEDGIIDYLDELTDAVSFFRRDQEAAKEFFCPEVIGAKDLDIYVGIEQDLYSDMPALRKSEGLFNRGHDYGTFDYIIGSVHAFLVPWDELGSMGIKRSSLERPDFNGIIFSEEGIYVYCDYSPEALKWAKDHIFKGDSLALSERYFRAVSDIVSVTDCDIVGHFDLLLKFNEKEKLFDETDQRYIKARDLALDRIFSDFSERGYKPVFEVNTGAMARGYRTIPYPEPGSLRAIKERGGQVVINSDCHQAKLLDYGFDQAREYVLSLGFKESTEERITRYI